MLWRLRLNVWLLVVADVHEVLLGASGSAVTPLQFGTAINVAGRQRMLSQRMSKEFFLIAKGHEVVKNKELLMASITLFHSSLGKLINGSDADGIPAAPSENSLLELRKVSDLWLPFKVSLEDNMNRDPVPSAAVDYVVAHNLPLLKQANTAVSRLVDAAKGAGIATAGLQVDIAGRQRMLSQRMSKEVVMISLNINVPDTVQALRGTIDLFAASHDGLLRGQSFLGLPETRNICVLQQMRVVTDLWQQFVLVLRQVIISSVVTTATLKQVADMNPVLLREMNNAVTLYVTQPSNCPAMFSEGDWLRVLRELGHGQQTLWQCGRLFLQIASGVDATASGTLLESRFSSAETSVRTVIEGSIASQIRPPVTQPIADILITAWSDWAHFHDNVKYSINHPPITLFDVERLFLYGAVTFDKAHEGFALYSEAAAASGFQLPIGATGLAEELGIAVERMVFEAFLGHFRRDPACASKVEAATSSFLRAKGELLHGRPAAAGMPAVNRTMEVCTLRHMQTVSTLWEPLVASADRFNADVASGAELLSLSRAASHMYEPLRTTLDLYSFGSEGCRLAVSGDEWQTLLLKAGRLVALSQVTLTELTLASRGVKPPWSGTRLAATRAEISATLTNLTFGAPSSGSPSPPNQAVADQLFRLRDIFAADGQLGSMGGRRLSAASAMLASESEALAGLYAEALHQAKGANASSDVEAVTSERILASARQWMRVERLVRLAAELQPGKRQDVAALRHELLVFEETHQLLLEGTADVPRGELGFVPETMEQPILPQMQLVLDALEPVKAQVNSIATAGYASDAALMQLSFNTRALAVETERMAQLYGMANELSQVSVARIIVPLPLTGSWAPGGVMRVAATLAQEIINQQQRILPGIAIEASFMDDRCDDRDGMRGLLERITSNTSWVGLGGMACSSVCGSTAIVASSVRLPAVSYGCAATYLSDSTLYPGFVRLGTPLTGTVKMLSELARRFNWAHVEVVSDTTNYHSQDPQALVDGLRQTGLNVDWQTTSSGNWHQLKLKAAQLLQKKLRQVLLIGDELFVRSSVCAVMLAGVTKGVTWISSGPKKRDWIQENDARVMALDSRCTGAALSDFMQGMLNIRATGMASPNHMDTPLDCLKGYTSRSFLDLVEQRLAALQPSDQYGTLDLYDGVAGLAADGTCVFAYALRSLQQRGYSLQEMQTRSKTVYQQTLAYLQEGLAFMGVSGNVSFNGNDKPGDLGVWQFLGNSTVEVGIEDPNGTVTFDVNGGPSDQAWSPHPPEPIPPEFPWLILPIVGIILVVCAACLVGGLQGLRASKASGSKAGGKAELAEAV